MISSLVESNISIKRIEKFLLTKELMIDCIEKNEFTKEKDSIIVRNGNFSWTFE